MKHDYSFINGIERLESIYGEKLCFHDAEVTRIELSRDTNNDGPTLTIYIHLFAVEGIDKSGNLFIFGRNNLVAIRFTGIDELDLGGFNEQNVLSDIEATHLDQPNDSQYEVSFPSSYGVSMNFKCRNITLVSIEPYQEA